MATFTTPSGAVVDDKGTMISGPTGAGSSTITPPVQPGAQTQTGTPNGTQSDFMNQLQNTLLQQSGIVSSDNSQLEQKIQDAISGVKSGNDASAQALTLDYNRQIGQAQQAGAQQVTSAQEASRGYATNTAALKQLTDNTTKQVNDLEQRKQELILQGDASTASQVSALQVQAIQFHQQAQQQVFSNLLGLGNYAQNVAQTQNQAAQFQSTLDFQNQQAISTIATKYGISVAPGETLQSITTKAMPYASAEEKGQLDQIQSQIRVNNANAAKALTDANTGGPYNIDALAMAVNNGGAAVLAGIKDPNIQSQVINRASDLKWSSQATQAASNGQSKADYNASIVNNQALSATDKSAALKASDTAYANAPAAKTSTGGSGPLGAFGNIIDSLSVHLGFTSQDQVDYNNLMNKIGTPNFSQADRTQLAALQKKLGK